MNRLVQAIHDREETLHALSDDQLVTLVLQLEKQPWGNWQDTVFYHAAPRLAAKLAALGWSAAILCDLCGSDNDVAYRGWTDDGSPIATCAEEGTPWNE